MTAPFILPSSDYAVHTTTPRERLVVLTLLVQMGYDSYKRDSLREINEYLAPYPFLVVHPKSKTLGGNYTEKSSDQTVPYAQFLSAFNLPAGYEVAEGSDVVTDEFVFGLVDHAQDFSGDHLKYPVTGCYGMDGDIGKTVAQAEKEYAYSGVHCIWLRPIKVEAPVATPAESYRYLEANELTQAGDRYATDKEPVGFLYQGMRAGDCFVRIERPIPAEDPQIATLKNEIVVLKRAVETELELSKERQAIIDRLKALSAALSADLKDAASVVESGLTESAS